MAWITMLAALFALVAGPDLLGAAQRAEHLATRTALRTTILFGQTTTT